MRLGAVAHLPNEGEDGCPVFILKFVHCYSKDVASKNGEQGAGNEGNGKLKQNHETENW